MAKKKKSAKGQQTFLSERQYVKEKARTLEIGSCFINEDYEESGLGHIVVTRLHKGGRKTIGVYMVDIFCLGVKDAFFRTRMEEADYEDMLLTTKNRYRMKEIPYEEAHNLIYGAIEFASEAGIDPCPEFSLAKYVLEEDTEAIPLIEYEFGKDGKHFLIARDQNEADKYLPILRENLGSDFHYIVQIAPLTDSDTDENEYSVEDMASGWSVLHEQYEKASRWNRPYSYKHPQYPETLDVKNPSVLAIISDPVNANYLSESQLDEILAVPADSLRKDLENILLYNIGLSCDGVPEEMREKPFSGVVGHCVMLLGEVGNEKSSLEAVLETLRQSDEFLDYHFADISHDIVVPTLCRLAGNRLDTLMDFMKERGLEAHWKNCVSDAVSQMSLLEPDRKPEIVAWFSELLRAINKDFPSADYTDAFLNGLIVSDVLNLGAESLLPEIKTMYDNEFVDLMACGDYADAEKDMLSEERYCDPVVKLGIRERYSDLKETFGK